MDGGGAVPPRVHLAAEPAAAAVPRLRGRRAHARAQQSLAARGDGSAGRVTIRLLHTLALFWMMAGIGAVIVPIWKAWATGDLDVKALLLQEAQRNEVQWLIPGMLATLFTGVAWVSSDESTYNFVTTGWLLALEIIFALDGFIFLPLMGVGLRR